MVTGSLTMALSWIMWKGFIINIHVDLNVPVKYWYVFRQMIEHKLNVKTLSQTDRQKTYKLDRQQIWDTKVKSFIHIKLNNK